MKAIKISENVYWVGAIDWGIRDFHGYATSRGTTYNAFLVMADKIALIDTVKRPFMDEMLARIASVVAPEDIDFIVSNHAEMDHSGSLSEIAALIKPAKIYASAMGAKALHDHFGDKIQVEPVADGSELSLGNMKLKFVETRMLHWPDSMFSFLEGDDVLFSQDAFGMHLASSERFADEVPLEILKSETAKYFANILLPYSNFVEKLIARWPSLGIKPKIIAPDHGPLWRDGKFEVIDWYAKFAAQKPASKVIVTYDTMWRSTEAMAASIAAGISDSGVSVKVMPLSVAHRSDVATELLDAAALVVGSPTLNGTIFPTVADLLFYLKGLRRKSLIGMSFGSFGWGGEAVGVVDGLLKDMKVELVRDGLKVKYVPRAEDLAACYQAGLDIAAKVRVLTC